MDGVFVVEVEYEEVRKVLMEEMAKCCSSDVPLYVRKLELIRRLKGEDGIAVRLDSLLETRSSSLRSEIKERIIDQIKAKKEELAEVKQRAVSGRDVDLSEAEIVSDTLDCYEGIAERNDYYVRIV